MLANALVQVSGCIPDIICVAQITLKFIDSYPRTNCRNVPHKITEPSMGSVGGLLLFRGENLADLLRLKDKLDLHSNFCAHMILHFSFY